MPFAPMVEDIDAYQNQIKQAQGSKTPIFYLSVVPLAGDLINIERTAGNTEPDLRGLVQDGNADLIIWIEKIESYHYVIVIFLQLGGQVGSGERFVQSVVQHTGLFGHHYADGIVPDFGNIGAGKRGSTLVLQDDFGLIDVIIFFAADFELVGIVVARRYNVDRFGKIFENGTADIKLIPADDYRGDSQQKSTGFAGKKIPQRGNGLFQIGVVVFEQTHKYSSFIKHQWPNEKNIITLIKK